MAAQAFSIAQESTFITEDKKRFVSRDEWEAGTPSIRKRLQPPVGYVVFSYTNSIRCDNKTACIQKVQEVYNCQVYGCQLPDIKYNFLIGGDGRVYEGRGWNFMAQRYDRTDKLGPINNNFIEISFICKDDATPNEEMSKAAAALVREGIGRNILKSEVKATTIWKKTAIPKHVRDIQNLRVSKYVENPPDKFFSG